MKTGIESKFRGSMVLEVSLAIGEVAMLVVVHRKIKIKALQECLERTVKGMTIQIQQHVKPKVDAKDYQRHV